MSRTDNFIDACGALVALLGLYLELVWLYLQLYALHTQNAAAALATWFTSSPIQWLAAACGLAGAFLLATKSRWASMGWLAFLASNAGWIWYAWRNDVPALLAQQIGFTTTSLMGVWVWLIKPQLHWDEWRGDDAGHVVMHVKHLMAWRGRKVDLHCIVAPDAAGCFHTHPANAVRLVMWNGYIEQIEQPQSTSHRLRDLHGGSASLVAADMSHRIHALPRGMSYSLWLRGRKTREIKLRGPSWRAAE